MMTPSVPSSICSSSTKSSFGSTKYGTTSELTARDCWVNVRLVCLLEPLLLAKTDGVGEPSASTAIFDSQNSTPPGRWYKPLQRLGSMLPFGVLSHALNRSTNFAPTRTACANGTPINCPCDSGGGT